MPPPPRRSRSVQPEKRLFVRQPVKIFRSRNLRCLRVRHFCLIMSPRGASEALRKFLGKLEKRPEIRKNRRKCRVRPPVEAALAPVPAIERGKSLSCALGGVRGWRAAAGRPGRPVAESQRSCGLRRLPSLLHDRAEILPALWSSRRTSAPSAGRDVPHGTFMSRERTRVLRDEPELRFGPSRAREPLPYCTGGAGWQVAVPETVGRLRRKIRMFAGTAENPRVTRKMASKGRKLNRRKPP
jgi:hypothetical protein